MDDPFPEQMMPCIEKFFRDVHPWLPPGRHVYPEVFASDLFFPLQRMRETAKMMRIAHRYEPKVVAELGCDKGGSLYHWCMCLPTLELLIACEIRGCPYRELFSQAFPQIEFCWMERSSRPPPALGKPIDVLFIDGEKPCMYDDFEAYLPLMSQRSVVFIHDINDSYGASALDLVEKNHPDLKTERIIDTTEVGEVLNRPAKNPYESWLQYWRGRSAGFGVVYIGAGD